MDLSLRFGRVKVGPWMLLLGIAVHFLVPGIFLLGAYFLDKWWGWRLAWPLWLRLPVGGLLVAASLALEAASLPHFFRHGGSPSPFQPTEELVVTGPYRYCRNPIYLAYTGYLLGAGIMLGIQSSFLVVMFWWSGLAAHAKFVEERSLRRRFGEQFETYRRATPFMIPRPRRRGRF